MKARFPDFRLTWSHKLRTVQRVSFIFAGCDIASYRPMLGHASRVIPSPYWFRGEWLARHTQKKRIPYSHFHRPFPTVADPACSWWLNPPCCWIEFVRTTKDFPSSVIYRSPSNFTRGAMLCPYIRRAVKWSGDRGAENDGTRGTRCHGYGQHPHSPPPYPLRTLRP